ncbi:MAG: DMT family transporter [Verrucomicrobia bacterium]|nr:DMT family transporter [Verrucomicrobiota bacterium]
MTDPQHPQRTQAILMLVLANLLWGVSFPIVKALLLIHEQLIPQASPWFSALYTTAPRFLFAVGLMVIFRPRNLRGITRGELKQGVVLGLFTATGMFLQNDALQFTHASTSAFLTQFYAIMIPLVLAIRARRSPGGRVWVCCALVLAGVAILGQFNWRDLSFGRGEWETLLCSVFFMGQILWLGKKEFAGNDSERLSFVMFATEGIVFWTAVAALAPDVHAVVAPWKSGPWVGLTVMLAVFCTLGAFLLMNKWQPKITATEAGLIYCVEPIFSAVMALFLPAWFSAWAGINYANETATWTLLVGGGLITLANVVLQLKPPADV